MSMKSEEYILLDDVARELSVTRGSVNRWCEKGDLEKFGRGRDAYTTKKSFDALVEKKEMAKTMLTLTQLSKLTGCTMDSLRYKIKKGELNKAVKYGSVDYFDPACVDEIAKTCKPKKKKVYKKDDDDVFKCDELNTENVTWNAFIRFGGAVIKSFLNTYKTALKDGRCCHYHESWIRGKWFAFYSAGLLDPEYIIRYHREKYWGGWQR